MNGNSPPLSRTAALPFRFRTTNDVVGAKEITTTREIVHGLLRLDGDRLTVQWRRSRTTDRVGREIRTDRELEPVKELALPLSALAGATVRWSLFRWPPGWHLHLGAADLRAFEVVAGEGGLRLRHPAELVIRIASSARETAREFASELELALAERMLRSAEESQQLAGERQGPALLGETEVRPGPRTVDRGA